MPYLVVCRLDQIAEAAVRHGAREMVSLVAAEQAFHRPGIIDANRHLNLGLNDIVEAQEGLVAPGEDHVARIIRFASGWDRRAPLVVHCWLGISRSPAAALITALAVAPDQDDDALARRLRNASPFVTPNARLIDIADAMLSRGGRLRRAVHAIGRGADTMQGDIFVFPLRAGDTAPEPKAAGRARDG